jgi:hypothetical protein
MAAKEGPDGAGFEGPPQESKGEGKEEGFEPAPVAARAGRRRRAADEVPDSEAKDGPPPRRPSALQEGGWRLDGTGEPRGDAPQMKSVEADELPRLDLHLLCHCLHALELRNVNACIFLAVQWPPRSYAQQ